MAATITFMGGEGGEQGGRLTVGVKDEYADVVTRLDQADGYVEFTRSNGKTVAVNPRAVAFISER